MANLQSWLVEAKNKLQSFQSVESILTEITYVRPPPCTSSAKKTLDILQIEFNKKFEFDIEPKTLAIRSYLKFKSASIDLINGELETGIAQVRECWEMIKNVECHPLCGMLALTILTELGKCYCVKEDSRKEALLLLKEAEWIYHWFKENPDQCPINPATLFNLDSENKPNWKPFEVAYGSTLFYLAKTYNFMAWIEKTAYYSELFLSRHNQFVQLDPTNWILKIADLSALYSVQEDYVTARHLLACASYVLAEYESSLDEGGKSKLSYLRSEISMGWIAYFQNLAKAVKVCDRQPKVNMPPRIYTQPEVSEIEEKFPLLLSHSISAKTICQLVQDHSKQVEKHYGDSEASVYVLLQLTQATVYDVLIRFEKDLPRVSEMLEKKIDVLEETLTKSRLEEQSWEWKSFQFVLATSYSRMVDAELAILHGLPEDQKQAAVNKIKTLVSKTVSYFEKFLETLKDGNGLFPVAVPENVTQGALLAQFSLGMLYKHILTVDPSHSEGLNGINQIKEQLNCVFDYLKKNPSQMSCVQNAYKSMMAMAKPFLPEH